MSFLFHFQLELMGCHGHPDEINANIRSMESDTPFQILVEEANDFGS